MSHDHSHHHSSKNLKAAFFLNLGFTIFELFGGMYVNSIAIISDAVHDLGDSLSLGLAWYLDVKSKKGATEKFSFGYNRFSLLGALINSLVLITGSVFVIILAVDRFFNPEQTDAKGMMIFAIIGVAVNGYAAWKLSSGKTLNERVVSWHLMEDVLGWVAVLIVAIVLMFKDIPYLDPALSILITLYILWNVMKRLKETLFIFLQGTPDGFNIKEIEDQLLTIEHVDSMHHTHLWSLEGDSHVFTTHVKLKNITELCQIVEVKQEVKEILKEYHLQHYTVETELDDETCELSVEKKHEGD
jgi:cobalt-zinc-cadmium efflux system protein